MFSPLVANHCDLSSPFFSAAEYGVRRWVRYRIGFLVSAGAWALIESRSSDYHRHVEPILHVVRRPETYEGKFVCHALTCFWP